MGNSRESDWINQQEENNKNDDERSRSRKTTMMSNKKQCNGRNKKSKQRKLWITSLVIIKMTQGMNRKQSEVQDWQSRKRFFEKKEMKPWMKQNNHEKSQEWIQLNHRSARKQYFVNRSNEAWAMTVKGTVLTTTTSKKSHRWKHEMLQFHQRLERTRRKYNLPEDPKND